MEYSWLASDLLRRRRSSEVFGVIPLTVPPPRFILLIQSRVRSWLTAFILAAVWGSASLFLAYVFWMPTSDIRTHEYILIYLMGWKFAATALSVFVVIGFIGTWIAGWRSRWSLLGVFLGALIPLGLIYERVMGLLVWMHEEDMSAIGLWARVACAVLTITLATYLLRAPRVDGRPT